MMRRFLRKGQHMGEAFDTSSARNDDLYSRVNQLEQLVLRLMGGRETAGPEPAAVGHMSPARPTLDPSSFRAVPTLEPRQPAASSPKSFPLARAKFVRRIIGHRRRREHHFSADLFADPAWDMMLDLYAAYYERREISVSSLCIAAAVPATTALRWIKLMVDEGKFIRIADPDDGRRIMVKLSEETRAQLDEYFDDFED